MGANPPEDADVWIENGSTLYFRNADGVFVPLTVIHGKDGKSAYEQAVDAGYKGTLEQFTVLLNNLTASIEGSHLADINNPHNVTAKQAGALPINGGTLTGAEIYMSEGLARLAGGKDYVQLDVFDNVKDSANRRKLVLNGGNKTTIDKALIISSTVDGKEEVFIIYGTHNKPKASDVGAVPTTGGTITGPLVIDKPSSWGQIIFHTPSGYYRAFEADDSRVRIDVRDEQDTNKRRYIDIFTNEADSRHSHALRFGQTVDGENTSAYILHTENIKDFVISEGTYAGTGTTTANNGKQLTIRPTTMAVIVDCIDDDSTECHTVLLVRGSKYCASPTAGQNLMLAWENGRVTIGSGYYNTLNNLGKTYKYILIG